MNFTEEQIERYNRQIILKDVGEKGQEILLKSRILIIGVGGLGSPVALYLTAAGVGTIGIVDGDTVNLSNLQRQIIHYTSDLEKHKTDSARNKIAMLNPDVTVKPYKMLLTSENAMDIINEYDFVIDCTDNFPAKFLINDACVLAEKSFSHGGILRFTGQTLTYTPGSACYRCVFPDFPSERAIPPFSETGLLGSVPGMLGTIQATEALKFILKIGNLLTGRMLVLNALDMSFRSITVNKNPKCPVCGEQPLITELTDYELR